MRKRWGAGFSGAIGVALVLTASAGATFPGVAGLIVGDGGNPNLNEVLQILVVSAAGGPASAIGYGSEPKSSGRRTGRSSRTARWMGSCWRRSTAGA